MTALDLNRERDLVNIAAYLPEMARTRPYAPAVVCPAGRRAGRACYTHWTFRELERESNAIAWGLEKREIGRGTRAAVMVPPSLEFFALVFALFKMGAVPVLIDPGMGVRSLGRCLEEAAPEAFFGIPKAQLARRLLGWGRKSIRIAVTVGEEWSPWPYLISLGYIRAYTPHSSEPYPIARTQPEETAAILFTSGSTGPPKGAVYTHAIFDAQVAILRDLYGIELGEIDLCTFPLFALFAPALGMTAVVPDMDPTRPGKVDPSKIFEAIESFGVTNLFGSPALLKRVGEAGASRGKTLPTLKRVISAGAPVPSRVIAAFATMLGPGVQVFTPYGATEALPVASIGSDEILGDTRHETDRGAGVCVGRPVPGMRVAIIKISDDPFPSWSDDLLVPDGTVGEITVRGPVVTRAYDRRPEATALAKIADPESESGQGGFWHRMGDLGYRDDRGRIWFCGRKSQRVVTETGTLYTIPCEAVFNTHPDVARTALVGVGLPGRARPVLCVEPRQWPRSKGERERIRRELLDLGASRPHTRSIETILFHRAFPVDIRHNAKIFRERLADWAAGRLP